MKTWTLECEQMISKPRDEVFAFFRCPENLERITPEALGFVILTPKPVAMAAGQVIDYTIRPFGFAIHWRTLITEYNPPHHFVDIQLKGPYALWHHTHSFEDLGSKTRMRDRVVYALPLGPLGRFVHAVAVRRQLKGIFEYRKRVIEGIFSAKGG